MRRLLTLALALGLVAVAAAAAVDALRDGAGTLPPPPQERPTAEAETSLAPSWPPGGAELAGRLRRNGVRGTLYLSADGCLDGTTRRLRALELPDLTLTDGPRSRSCSFTVSADGEDAAGPDAVWSPRASTFAAETGPGELTLIDVRGGEALTLAGSAPAFKPDGTLTSVKAGRVVEWTEDCAGATESGPYCARTLVARDELERPLSRFSRVRAVDALVWTQRTRLLAVLRSRESSWLAAFDAGRSLGWANSLAPLGARPPRADPTGEQVALNPRGFLEVYDRNAGRAWAGSLEALDYDWSPDGLWLAVAAPRRLVILRSANWTVLASLPFTTEGVAWR